MKVPGARLIRAAAGGGAKGCEFTLWAPLREDAAVVLTGDGDDDGGPGRKEEFAMERDDLGYWTVTVEDAEPGTLYMYSVDGGTARPDPASHHQPRGVHGPSAVVDHASFAWDDGGWKGVALEDMVVYEIHTGTFTPEGTFDGAVARLDELAHLGVNTVEVMPVAQFPGTRNWGYDGAFPFAVQDSYGGPAGLKRFVNECHRRGISVTLDVVYNHLGPEGSYLGEFAPYFTDRHRTPWGRAVNFDGPWSNGVREYFIANALHWFSEYHVDALRLDALHAIVDISARPFLRVLAERVEGFSKKAGRSFYLIGENDLNDSRTVRPPAQGGYGLDAEWCDDFHHCLHTLLTGEDNGYYGDFGKADQMVKAFTEGHVYSGQYSKYRLKDHGNPSADVPAFRFVVFGQNHDQTGNRALGERLSALVDYESLKLAAGVVLTAPSVPLLFMGEEYGETNPFLYFTSHTDPGLVEAVREGRRREFSAFSFADEPPDPQDPATFARSVLNWEKRRTGLGLKLLEFYRKLIGLRREVAALANLSRRHLRAWVVPATRVVAVERWSGGSRALCLYNFDTRRALVKELPGCPWSRSLDSAAAEWDGPGSRVARDVAAGTGVTVEASSLVIFTKKER